MAHLRINRFTCDRCDSSVDIETNSTRGLGRTQPEGWVRVTVTAPPLASPLEVKGIDMVLCDLCAELVERCLRDLDSCGRPVPKSGDVVGDTVLLSQDPPDEMDIDPEDEDADPHDPTLGLSEPMRSVAWLSTGSAIRDARPELSPTLRPGVTYTLHTADPSAPVLTSGAEGYPRQDLSWASSAGASTVEFPPTYPPRPTCSCVGGPHGGTTCESCGGSPSRKPQSHRLATEMGLDDD